MGVQQIAIGSGALRRSPVPGGPLAEVLLGAGDDAPVGVVSVTVAPGGAMPEHDHGPSAVVLIALAGGAQVVDVADGERVVPLTPGTITTIAVGRRVRLQNPGPDDARLLVVVSPPDFARGLAAWPAAEG